MYTVVAATGILFDMWRGKIRDEDVAEGHITSLFILDPGGFRCINCNK